jgi:tetratricopeptide (TPR) repeat protein/tRNA A-37 threonylcarbamoyl transferase component Bud32
MSPDRPGGRRFLLAQADQVCDRFESAWRAGARPRIEDYLEGVSEPVRALLFRELLAAELELRQKAGEPTDQEEYAARFPAHRALIGTVFAESAASAHCWSTSGPAPAEGPPGGSAGPSPRAAALLRRFTALLRGGWRNGEGEGEAAAAVPTGTPPITEPDGAATTDGSRAGSAPNLAGTQPLTGQPGGAAEVKREVGSTDETCDRAGTSPAAGIGPSSLASLSQYDLLSELGRGGMGVVFKARHRQLNRIVALKMLGDGRHILAENRARFLIEGEAVARLHHRHIVQIHEIGEADGHPFVTLELLEGGSLADRLRGATQPGRAAAALVAALAEAMHTAHGAGIVHRDLKPSNVLFDRDGVAKIVDFGLARRLEVEEGHTQAGQVMGTPSYMAPEQARGLTHQAGPAADIYALGTILYEMLTGRPPFKGPTPHETIHQVIHDDVVLPSRLQPKVARDLETICLKCLQKDPQKRYGSAAELAGDLRAYLEDRPIRARRTPVWERSAKWVRRHPARAAVAGLAALAAALLVAAGRIEVQRVAALGARSDQELFQAQADVAQKKWTDAQSIVTRLLTLLEPEPRLKAQRDRAAGLLVQVNRGLEELGTERKNEEIRRQDYARYERFLQRRDTAFFHETQFTGLDRPVNRQATRAAAREALSEFAAAAQGDRWTLAPLPRSLAPRERTEIVEGCYELLLILAGAVAEPLAGEDPKAQAARGLEILDQAARLVPEPSRAYHLHRARCLARAHDGAGEAREHALAERLEPATARDHFLAGRERASREQWNAAAEEFDAALQLQPDHFWAQCLAAHATLQAGRPAEAKAGLNACLRREPGLVWLYLLRAHASGQAAALALVSAKMLPARAREFGAVAENQFALAEADYGTAADMLRRQPGAGLHYTLLINRGQMRYEHERLDLALADLQEAIARDGRRYEAVAALAKVLDRQQRWDEAVEQLTRAIGLKPDYPPLYRERARVQEQRDRPTPAERRAALDDLDEAIRHEPPGAAIVADDQSRRGNLLRLLGRNDEALSACDRALEVLPSYAPAHHQRVRVLLALKRYDEVIGSCDAALAEGKAWPGLHEIRGAARAGRQQFAGAIADYTLALEQQPGQPRVLIERGLTYLVTNAPELALVDFEEALRLDPSSGQAHIGRGSALVHLGKPRAAVDEAETGLRLGPPTPRLYYSAARVYARAAEAVAADVRRKGRDAVLLVNTYQDRAVGLVGEALQRLPTEARSEWYSQIRTDKALESLSRRLRLADTARASRSE